MIKLSKEKWRESYARNEALYKGTSHSKIIRIQDKPKTTYQRILDSRLISNNKKNYQ